MAHSTIRVRSGLAWQFSDCDSPGQRPPGRGRGGPGTVTGQRVQHPGPAGHAAASCRVSHCHARTRNNRTQAWDSKRHKETVTEIGWRRSDRDCQTIWRPKQMTNLLSREVCAGREIGRCESI